MKKIAGIIMAISVLSCNVGVIEAAVEKKTADNIVGWEKSYWQKDTETSGLTDGGTGIDVTDNSQIVKNGKGTLSAWVEKSASNLKACVIQRIGDLESGSKYRLTGNIYFSSGTSATYGFGLYIGEERVARLNQFATANQWSEVDYTFEYDYNTYQSRDLSFVISMKGTMYADDLSLKKVIYDGDSIVGYGEELLENGDFEQDFVLPGDVIGLSKEEYENQVILSWQNPDSSNFNGCVIYKNGVEIAKTGNDVSSYPVFDLENGESYEFVVKTANKRGMLSEGVSITAIPHKPLTLPAVIKDDYANRIIGITEDMEYSINTADNWQRYQSANPPVLDGNVTVYVRMYSNISGVEIPVQVLYFTENVIAGEDILLEEVKLIENKLTVGGRLKEKKQVPVTMIAVRKGAERRDYDSIIAIGECKSDKDGVFLIEKKVADSRKGIDNDGDYTLYIDAEGYIGVVYDGVSFVSTGNRNRAISELLQSDDPGSLLDGVNKKAYEAIGIDVSDYENFATSKTSGFFKTLINGYSEGDAELSSKLADAFNKALMVTSVEEATDEEIYQLLKKYNRSLQLTYNGESCQQLIEKGGEEITALCKYLKGKTLNNISEFETEYKKALALFNINNATYGDIGALISDNEQLLGISDNPTYASYKSFVGEKKTNIDKSLVIYKSSNPFATGANIISALTSILEGNQDSGNSGNGGGSGGSGGGGGVVTSRPNPTPYFEIVVGAETTKEQVFKDIEVVQWAKESIMKLYEKKIVSGYGNGIFAPQRNITREEYAKMLVCILGIENTEAECSFIDVQKDKWYYMYIASAVEKGLVSGVSQTEFGVGRNITREEMATMTYRALNLLGVEVDSATPDFTDNDNISDYAREAIGSMQSMGVINGYADGSFGPKYTATRAEACKICSVVLDKRGG